MKGELSCNARKKVLRQTFNSPEQKAFISLLKAPTRKALFFNDHYIKHFYPLGN